MTKGHRKKERRTIKVLKSFKRSIVQQICDMDNLCPCPCKVGLDFYRKMQKYFVKLEIEIKSFYLVSFFAAVQPKFTAVSRSLLTFWCTDPPNTCKENIKFALNFQGVKNRRIGIWHIFLSRTKFSTLTIV